MATAEQQLLRKHYQGQISILLQELDAALAALPTSTQAISRSLPAAASILGHVEKSTEDSWTTMGGCLRIIWQRPGGVGVDHVARHKNGALQSSSRLLHRVGAERMALLEDKDRLEAINWISAFRDAALASPTHVATPIHSAASVGRVKSATQPPVARARGARADVTSSGPKSNVRAEVKPTAPLSATRDVKPTIKQVSAAAAPRRAASTPSSSALAWAAPLPPPSSAKRALVEAESASSATPVESRPRSTFTSADRPSAPARPKSKSISQPLSNSAGKASTSTSSDLGPAVKKRKTTTTPSSSPPPPPPEKKGTNAKRPQRQRKATKKLDEVEEVEARELIKAASEDARYEVGEAVQAKFPSYSWWPAIILDPSTAPEWTQGTQKLGYYLCKSIPTGGDHRWISPADIRELDETQINEVIIPNKYESPPPVSWKQYRAELIEGCLIALDPVKLHEWGEKPTESDVARELEAGKRQKM